MSKVATKPKKRIQKLLEEPFIKIDTFFPQSFLNAVKICCYGWVSQSSINLWGDVNSEKQWLNLNVPKNNFSRLQSQMRSDALTQIRVNSSAQTWSACWNKLQCYTPSSSAVASVFECASGHILSWFFLWILVNLNIDWFDLKWIPDTICFSSSIGKRWHKLTIASTGNVSIRKIFWHKRTMVEKESRPKETI